MRDDPMLELMMVLVDKLGGDVTVTEDDVERVVDGKNELHVTLPEGSLRLRIEQ